LVTLLFIFVFLCSQELYLFILGRGERERDWRLEGGGAVLRKGSAFASPARTIQLDWPAESSLACVKNSIYSEYSIYMKVCVNGSVSK
jgi:hypothetical protein